MDFFKKNYDNNSDKYHYGVIDVLLDLIPRGI